MTWNPRQYLAYADERGRPFFDLMARVDADAPARVVDLGCGPGNLTRTLAERWPRAEITGVDSSAEMIAAAPRDAGVDFQEGDLADWAADADEVDVLISNATLQWVPGHLELLPRLAARVAPGGWLAVQVPGNFGAPSHVLRAELAAEKPYAEHLVDVAVPASHEPDEYYRALATQGWTLDVWETTYLHALRGPDAVFSWVSATGARPTLAALPAELRERFATEYRRRLALAYPERDGVVLLPFRRIFVVGRHLVDAREAVR